jgi:hypothetical protein
VRAASLIAEKAAAMGKHQGDEDELAGAGDGQDVQSMIFSIDGLSGPL